MLRNASSMSDLHPFLFSFWFDRTDSFCTRFCKEHFSARGLHWTYFLLLSKFHLALHRFIACPSPWRRAGPQKLDSLLLRIFSEIFTFLFITTYFFIVSAKVL